MTTGERIQRFRKLAKISGAELSRLSGISHTIIRKYETNRSVPKPAQIYKISEALNISPYAITGNEYNCRLKTIGDLYSLIIILYKSNLLWFDGIRNPDGKLCSSIECIINPIIEKFANVTFNNGETTKLDNLILVLNENISKSNSYNDFLLWEMYNDKLKAFIKRYKERHSNEDSYLDTIKALTSNIEEYEIKLLYSQEELKL